MKTMIRTSFVALVAGLMISGCQASAQVSTQPGAASPSPNDSSILVVESQFKATGSSNSATGTSSISLTPNKAALTISATASGLSGPASAAHVHRADMAGGDGPVVKNLTLNGNTASGTWSLTDASQPFSPAHLEDLRAGRLYINFHTAANPNGELRADLTVK